MKKLILLFVLITLTVMSCVRMKFPDGTAYTRIGPYKVTNLEFIASDGTTLKVEGAEATESEATIQAIKDLVD